MARTLSQMYFVLTSVSGVLMGMNCILFLFCVYVLWGQKSRFRRILLLSSIVQFSLCLTQIALYINYLIVAFTDLPGGAESHFQRNGGYSLACYIIYTINYAVEEFVLIWRVCVIYNNNYAICVPLIALLALQVGLSGVAAKGFTTGQVTSGSFHAFNLVTWALIAAVNATATVLICLRLWTARRRAFAVLSKSKYKSTIIVVVECGGLVTVCTIAMLILYAAIHPMDFAGIGVMTQVATMAPLLIIARHGILSRQDERRLVRPQMPLRITIVRTEDTRVDTATPVGTVRKKGFLPDPIPEISGDHHLKPFSDTVRGGEQR